MPWGSYLLAIPVLIAALSSAPVCHAFDVVDDIFKIGVDSKTRDSLNKLPGQLEKLAKTTANQAVRVIQQGEASAFRLAYYIPCQLSRNTADLPVEITRKYLGVRSMRFMLSMDPRELAAEYDKVAQAAHVATCKLMRPDIHTPLWAERKQAKKRKPEPDLMQLVPSKSIAITASDAMDGWALWNSVRHECKRVKDCLTERLRTVRTIVESSHPEALAKVRANDRLASIKIVPTVDDHFYTTWSTTHLDDYEDALFELWEIERGLAAWRAERLGLYHKLIRDAEKDLQAASAHEVRARWSKALKEAKSAEQRLKRACDGLEPHYYRCVQLNAVTAEKLKSLATK